MAIHKRWPLIDITSLRFSCLSLLLEGREHVQLDLLIAHEHDDVPGGETEEVGDEAAIEGFEAILLEGGPHTV